jgi:hypothetical protein
MAKMLSFNIKELNFQPASHLKAKNLIYMGVLPRMECLLILVVYFDFGDCDDCFPIRLEAVSARMSDMYTSWLFKTLIWKTTLGKASHR